MVLMAFLPSVSGMDAQSHAMNTVSTNIANMRTIGYKNQQTLFYTMLGSQPAVKGQPSIGYSDSRVSGRADVNGVGWYDRTNVTRQGVVSSTGNPYDVAINSTGNAFFAVKDDGGKIFYTRAGDFNTRSENGIPYLINNSGMYVQGFAANKEGGFNSSLEDIKIDYPNKSPSVPTTSLKVSANVPSTDVERSSYGLTIYGPNNDGETMNMIFNKVEGKVNTWNVTFAMENAAVSSSPVEVVFDAAGQVISPKNFDIAVNWPDGSSNQVNIDISPMTQLDGNSGLLNVTNDGLRSGNFIEGYIDSDGIVKARYDNGQIMDFAKLALVSFVAPDNLTNVSGTLFEWNNAAGESSYLMGPDTENKELLSARSVENSTANVEKDFADMVVIQRAYSMNTKSFSTINEMTELLISLKA